MKVPFLHKRTDDTSSKLANTDDTSSKLANIGKENTGTTVMGNGNITNVNMLSNNPTELTNEEKQSLKEFFLDDFKQLPIFNSSTYYSIEEYQPLSLSLKKDDLDTFMSEEELFEELNQAKKVNLLIIGDIGSGKTTLVKRLVYDAFSTQSLNQYDFIFYIDLANMDDNVTDIQSLVSTQYHHILPQRSATIKIDLNAKNLFIFDGLDKIKSQSQKSLFYKIQKPIPYKIIVSRNNSININEINHAGGILYVDGFKEIEELNEITPENKLEKLENANNSFTSFVKKLLTFNKQNRENEEILSLCYFLRQEKLLDIAKNPLILTHLSHMKSYKGITKLEFFRTINTFLIFEYHHFIYDNEQFDTMKYQELEMFTKRKLYTIAHYMYKEGEANHYLISMVTEKEELYHVLQFGFLKTNEFKANVFPRPYSFIHQMFKNIFVAEKLFLDYQDEENRTMIGDLLQNMFKEESQQILIFFYHLYREKKNYDEYFKNINDTIQTSIEKLEKEDIGKVIGFLYNTKVIVNNFNSKVGEYRSNIQELDLILQGTFNEKLTYIVQYHDEFNKKHKVA